MQVKVMFLFENFNFYVHNRHLAWLIGGSAVMLVKVMFVFEHLNFYLHNRHLTWHFTCIMSIPGVCYAGKIDVLLQES